MDISSNICPNIIEIDLGDSCYVRCKRQGVKGEGYYVTENGVIQYKRVGENTYCKNKNSHSVILYTDNDVTESRCEIPGKFCFNECEKGVGYKECDINKKYIERRIESID